MSDSIDRILQSRRPPETPPTEQKQEDRFFAIPISDGKEENFIEFQFRSGMRTCFSYSDLVYFNLDPEDGFLDLDFGSYLVIIKGRGLGARLFAGIKQKRVSWIKEADVEMQDHKDNSIFIEEITVTVEDSEEAEKA